MRRYPLLPLLLPRPQYHRRLARPEPELHHPLVPDRHEVEPRFQLPSAGVAQAEDAAPVKS